MSRLSFLLPPRSTEIVESPDNYEPLEGSEYEKIRIVALSAQEVAEKAKVAMGKDVVDVDVA